MTTAQQQEKGAARGMTSVGGRRRAGFTLLELIVVVGVIGILVAILFPAVSMARAKARERQATATRTALANAIMAFKAEYGYWPCPDPSVGGEFATASAQSGIINNYLLSTGGNNPQHRPFWEEKGCVTNWSTIPPGLFKIVIDVTNNTVAVY